jgi:hypothetical protein
VAHAPQNPSPLMSRRSLLKDATTAFAAGGAVVLGAALPASRIEAAAKMSQEVAQYQGSPKGDAHCEICAHFQPPSSCLLVDGSISPNGWCKFYKKKG